MRTIEPAWRSLVKTFGQSNNKVGLSRLLDKHQARFLRGRWRDVFFGGLLDRHEGKLGIRDVRLWPGADKPQREGRQYFRLSRVGMSDDG